ncbi:MAG: sulfatase [Saprospiraceae bacterium]
MNLLKKRITLLLFASISLIYACQQAPATEQKPNILWLYLEDTAPLLGCYGTTIIPTPHIDELAKKGVLFTNVYMPAPVCSPSRSSIITGMMSTTLGLHNHHSARTAASAIYLPDDVKTVPEVFKQAGYFTFNNGKDDYNFSYDRRALYDQGVSSHPLYGKRGDLLAIAELKDKTPFFGQIQLAGGKEIFNSKFKENVRKPVDRAKIVLPPYLPNHPAIIEEYANHLDAIQITDEKVGEIMKDLSENGLLDNTIVFFFSDHGMRLTRHKQFLYDGGLHVPLIIADFSNASKLKAGSSSDRLISGLDLGITSLALAGIPIPTYMEGKDFFSESDREREYVISTRDRCDFTIDRIRSVRSRDFKYIRNFMTDRPYTQPTYMDVDEVEFVKVMKQLHAEHKLDTIQDRFFLDERPAEELYNLKEDPFEINNLAGKPAYAETLKHYAAILDQWIKETDDKGQYPENEEGLKLMLGIWGKYAVNPEYEPLRKKYPDLAGSQFELKSKGWEQVTQ